MLDLSYSFFVQWHVTEACNLKCRHCYQYEKSSQLNFQQICNGILNIHDSIQSWVEEYSLQLSPSINFTGGEPVLRKDLFQIFDYARQLDFSISLMSNGTLITPEIARGIKASGINDVQISLDGLEDVHNSIRGSGSFKRAIKGIEYLQSQSIDININLTLSRININQIDGLVEFAKKSGISALSISRLVPCGAGTMLMNDMLTPSQLLNLYKSLAKYGDNDGFQVISRDPLASICAFEGNIGDIDFPVGGCAAGIFGITIASDGSIMPCRRMDMVIGNINEDSFRDIWAESEILWLLRDRKAYHGNCGKCEYWAVCRGCRAVALAVSRASGQNDYLGNDPQCIFFSPCSRHVA